MFLASFLQACTGVGVYLVGVLLSVIADMTSRVSESRGKFTQVDSSRPRLVWWYIP